MSPTYMQTSLPSRLRRDVATSSTYTSATGIDLQGRGSGKVKGGREGGVEGGREGGRGVKERGER